MKFLWYREAAQLVALLGRLITNLDRAVAVD
jgi:hypothetical protein